MIREKKRKPADIRGQDTSKTRSVQRKILKQVKLARARKRAQNQKRKKPLEKAMIAAFVRVKKQLFRNQKRRRQKKRQLTQSFKMTPSCDITNLIPNMSYN